MGCLPSFPEENSTLVHDEFDGTCPAVTDGKGAIFCPLGQLDDRNGGGKSRDQVFISVPAQARASAGWVDISLVFRFDLSKDSFEGRLFKVLRSGKRTALALSKGDSLRLLYGTVKDPAAEHPSPPIVLDHPDKLAITGKPLPPGEYLLGYRIQDFSGRTALQTARMEVKAQ
jgi:hypothetical protein